MERDKRRNPSETESHNRYLDPTNEDYKAHEDDPDIDEIRKKTPVTTGGNLGENEFITDRGMKKKR